MVIIKIVNKYNLCNIIFGFIYFLFRMKVSLQCYAIYSPRRNRDAWQTNKQIHEHMFITAFAVRVDACRHLIHLMFCKVHHDCPTY